MTPTHRALYNEKHEKKTALQYRNFFMDRSGCCMHAAREEQKTDFTNQAGECYCIICYPLFAKVRALRPISCRPRVNRPSAKIHGGIDVSTLCSARVRLTGHKPCRDNENRSGRNNQNGFASGVHDRNLAEDRRLMDFLCCYRDHHFAGERNRLLCKRV